MATPSLSPPPLNLWIILSESKRIINAHSRHFLDLSVRFLLPLSVFITLYPYVFLLITDQTSLLTTTMMTSIPKQRPVTLKSAVKFTSSRYFDLIESHQFDYASSYFQGFVTLVTIISIAVAVKLYVNWILAWVVVVVESAWGITPLKTSKRLVKGMKCASLSIIFFFASTESILVWISTLAAYALLNDNENGGKSWKGSFFFVQNWITSALLTLLMLYNLVATTVMYMYCKAVHGELVGEIAEEFAREYVSLPFDDGKVPHLVSVAYNNI
ncbi:hypothetical protein AXX17_AT2G02340 [Arabidopsis thaliana]|uniref:Transmembrane protein n=1 Tax=Arabidopsis thaliana TaxID=3702 RepID=A0A178VMW7_ARATH|nr:hypothetical protein AXX17_AT2G02290 [Arabidopsis thaliana]OAP08744.1 hypothetical protein AXX17_AT2G02340 [Arabidopsis thaliana]